MVGGIALNQSGLVFAGATGIHVWNGQNDYRTLHTEFEGDKLQFNDIIADAHGRVYAGTLYWGANGMEKYGHLYLFDLNGTVQRVDEGIEVSNGLGFSPDDKTLYYSDSSARKIYAYDVDAKTGKLANKRVFVQVPKTEGIPDGLTVDAAGYVWSAQWYGSQIVRYDPQGKVERRIQMPVTQVSSLIFGGKDFNEIYITSASNSWPSDYGPPGYDFNAPNIGGPLYRIKQDIQGRSEHVANLS
jgi:D-xylonolactonase